MTQLERVVKIQRKPRGLIDNFCFVNINKMEIKPKFKKMRKYDVLSCWPLSSCTGHWQRW